MSGTGNDPIFHIDEVSLRFEPSGHLALTDLGEAIL
jgi:hypothetical protein